MFKSEFEKDADMYSEYREKNIYGDNYSGFSTYCRKAARAVIVEDGKILLSHEKNIDQWMIPGGGMETDETPELCCIRETAEEMGLVVKPQRCFMVINEYYEDWKYVSYFFLCAVVGNTERNLTEREIEVGVVPEWIEADQAMKIFSHYMDFKKSNEERRGIYLREYLALSALLIGDENELYQNYKRKY